MGGSIPSCDHGRPKQMKFYWHANKQHTQQQRHDKEVVFFAPVLPLFSLRILISLLSVFTLKNHSFMSVSVSSCQSFPLQERLSAFRRRSFIWVGRREIYAHISAARPEICFVESHVIRFKYPMCTLTTPPQSSSLHRYPQL